MKALLVRVGVDLTFGRWNAPVDADRRFIYVPIPESPDAVFRKGMKRPFGEVLPALESFCAERNRNLVSDLGLPENLHLSQPMHLDPDFDCLTYGDNGGRRGAEMVGLGEDDLIVFYSGLRPVHACEHKLLYAIIGIFVVHQVLSVHDVPTSRCSENAHTRRQNLRAMDIVIRAKPRVSGRLEKCVPIGEWRDRAYRVRRDLLTEWGGLSVKNGYIQRSAVPPSFNDPDRFYQWLGRQNISLRKGNGWR